MLKSVWVVAQRGAVGMLNQAHGLAEALFAGGGFGLPVVKEISFRSLYTTVPMHPFLPA